MTNPPFPEGAVVILPSGRRAVVLSCDKSGFVDLRYVGIDPTDTVRLHASLPKLPEDWP